MPAAGSGEGDLFVPFSILPCQGTRDALGIRLRCLEGLRNFRGPRVSLWLRFGPPAGDEGKEVDKAKDLSIKVRFDLLRDGDGQRFLPVGGEQGGAECVELPAQLLAQVGRGVVCRLKVIPPGILASSAGIAASLPVSVPMEPGSVPLFAPRGTRSVGVPEATAELSISRLCRGDAQAAMARSLVQRLLQELKSPAPRGAPPVLPPLLDALLPARGWMAAAGVPRAFAAADAAGRSALRLSVDGGHWACLQPLLDLRCDARTLAQDLRSPLSAALEHGRRPEALLQLLGLGPEATAAACELSVLIRELRGSGSQASPGSPEGSQRWDTLADTLLASFSPPASGVEAAATNGHPATTVVTGRPPPPRPPPVPTAGGSPARPAPQAAAWSGDVLLLALEHCPTGRARRKLLSADGVCAALWCTSLAKDLPDLARKLAVWVGLSVNNGPAGSVSGSPGCRRRLLDVSLDSGTKDTMLARSLERGLADARWLKVARVMVHLGADCTGATAAGRSVLLLALEEADRGRAGFSELLTSLMEKIGDDVDHWQEPTVLNEENTAECPICMEVLYKSTPTSFVKYSRRGDSGEVPHVICAHFFCFDCASQQFMKQQSQNRIEFECPICRGAASEVMPLPDIAINPRLWFQFLDVEGRGRIDKNTVVQTLEAMLPIDTENLRESLQESVWAQWDKAGDGSITEREFFDSGGLLEWVRRHQHELRAAEARGPAPSLEEEPERWFRHWDAAKRGRLGRSEVLRGLCEAARVSSLEVQRIKSLKEGISAVWERHAPQGTVSREHFLKQGVAGELLKVVEEGKK